MTQTLSKFHSKKKIEPYKRLFFPLKGIQDYQDALLHEREILPSFTDCHTWSHLSCQWLEPGFASLVTLHRIVERWRKNKTTWKVILFSFGFNTDNSTTLTPLLCIWCVCWPDWRISICAKSGSCSSLCAWLLCIKNRQVQVQTPLLTHRLFEKVTCTFTSRKLPKEAFWSYNRDSFLFNWS